MDLYDFQVQKKEIVTADVEKWRKCMAIRWARTRSALSGRGEGSTPDDCLVHIKQGGVCGGRQWLEQGGGAIYSKRVTRYTRRRDRPEGRGGVWTWGKQSRDTGVEGCLIEDKGREKSEV